MNVRTSIRGIFMVVLHQLATRIIRPASIGHANGEPDASLLMFTLFLSDIEREAWT